MSRPASRARGSTAATCERSELAAGARAAGGRFAMVEVRVSDDVAAGRNRGLSRRRTASSTVGAIATARAADRDPGGHQQIMRTTREVAALVRCARSSDLPVTAATSRAGTRSTRGVREQAVSLVVLARYMQVLEPGASSAALAVQRSSTSTTAFLPAFMGARPDHQAHDAGVKIVGVTARLRDRASSTTADHRSGRRAGQPPRLGGRTCQRRGRDLEVAVLRPRPSGAHVEHRVLVHGRRTVVFD